MILIRTVPLGTKGVVAIHAPYHERFVEVAHTLPGLAFDRKLRVWTGYADTADILTETLVNEGIAKASKPHVSSLSVISDADRNKHNDKLYVFQQQARDVLLAHAYEGVMLADGLGLGKTRTSLAAIDLLPKPALIVCPSIVKHSWVSEGKELGIDVFQLSGVKPPEGIKIQESDGIVCINYDIVYAWLDAFLGVKTVVFDEGHNLCNSKSRRSDVCKQIAHQADYRILVTGTPFPAKPIELWNVVDTISPGRFGSYSKYGIRYAEGHQEEIEIQGQDPKKVWNFKGTSHPEELRRRVHSFMIRRMREDVALELPEKTRQMIELDVGGEALPNMIPSDIDQEWMRYALSLAARGKMTHAVELALGHLKEGSSVVVAAYRHEIANELEALFLKEGVEPFMATGEKTIPKRRQALMDAAKNQPCVTIVTTHAVGEGINELVFANVTIIVELDLSPRWIVQYEGRFHRQGQKRNVLYQYLIGMGSMDEIIRDRVLRKMKTFESIIGGMGESLTDDLAGSASEENLMAELVADIREMS